MAPSFKYLAISLPSNIPPATITGISLLYFSLYFFTSSTICTTLLSKFASSSSSLSLEYPKCPPALGPSTITISAVILSCLSHNFNLGVPTIGAIFTVLPFVSFGSIVGRPAPDMIISIPASIAALTCSAYSFVATIIFTPRIPFLHFSFANFISSFNAFKLHSKALSSKFLSLNPI